MNAHYWNPSALEELRLRSLPVIGQNSEAPMPFSSSTPFRTPMPVSPSPPASPPSGPALLDPLPAHAISPTLQLGTPPPTQAVPRPRPRPRPVRQPTPVNSALPSQDPERPRSLTHSPPPRPWPVRQPTPVDPALPSQDPERSRSLTHSSPPRPWPVRQSTPLGSIPPLQDPPHPHSSTHSPLIRQPTPVHPDENEEPIPSAQAPSQMDTPLWPWHALDAYQYLKQESIVGGEGEKVVATRNWGSAWVDCVEAFMEFQRLAGFPVSLLHVEHQ